MSYSLELGASIAKLIMALALVLALLWLAQRLTRRGLTVGGAGKKGRLIRVLGSQYLGVKKSIAVVQVPGSILVLGIGVDTISLLSRIDDPQAVTQLLGEEQAVVPRFAEQLQRLTRSLGSGATDYVAKKE